MDNSKVNRIQNLFTGVFRFGRKYIDYRMGVIGALVMAVVVFCINYFGTGTIGGSITAALKQGTYTFFFGGVIMRMSERIAVAVKKRTLALILACVIPSVVSLTLTFGVHSLKGIPEPLNSTIPTLFFVIPSTFIWGRIKRKKLESSDTWQTDASG
jgi:hypothetical protein